MCAKVAVVGAGVIGLSSACAIQNQLPSAKVTVIADKFCRDTTSTGAGGIFVPMPLGADEATYNLWASEGAKHFFDLGFSEHSAASGVTLITGYEVMNTLPENKQTPRPFFNYVPFHTEMSPELLRRFAPYYKYGYMFTTVIIDGSKYLPWLMDRFADKGGRCVQQKISSFEELHDDYDVVVNCTGLGSKDILPDPDLIPCRGHIVRVKAPWIKHFLHADDGRYVLPNSETVAVGGVKQMGRTDMAPLADETHYIFNTMKTRFPALEGSKILWDWIGLRPMRSKVRLEKETLRLNGKQMQIVHNYGHGAHGVSLSWGTGVHVAHIVRDLCQARSRL